MPETTVRKLAEDVANETGVAGGARGGRAGDEGDEDGLSPGSSGIRRGDACAGAG